MHLVAIPVPWAALTVPTGGVVVLTALVTAVALVFLRASTDPTELHTAA